MKNSWIQKICELKEIQRIASVKEIHVDFIDNDYFKFTFFLTRLLHLPLNIRYEDTSVEKRHSYGFLEAYYSTLEPSPDNAEGFYTEVRIPQNNSNRSDDLTFKMFASLTIAAE